MREIDTEAPVIWPAWCYSGEGADLESSGALPPSLPTAAPHKVRGKRRSDRMNGDSLHHHHHNNNNNNNNNLPVKNERLSPSNTTTSDNQSSASRSRSVTPSSSSYPGTPPQGSLDRGPSPGGPGGHPLAAGGPLAAAGQATLRHMEQVMGRNYSDFMRSLAAKYNNANPNDFFSSTRNGYPGAIDSRFSAFKGAPANTAPFAGIISPLSGGAPSPSTSSTSGSSPTVKETATDSPKKPDLVSSLFQGFPFPASAMFPPLIDMSSTQALVSMVRAAKEAELQTLMKAGAVNANKRPNESSPLDLSSASGFLASPAAKKQKLTKSEMFLEGGKPSSPGRRRCPGLPLCPGDVEVVNWGVEDVCNFVSGIDICAEYAQNFRDQCIDGSGLPLLTEEHLTGSLGMKLGPALKLRSILAKRLAGTCAFCAPCTSPLAPPSPSSGHKDNPRPCSRSSNSNS